MTSYPVGRSSYKPGHARMGEPTPQSDPELFSDEDIRAEIAHLRSLDRRHGAHFLRAEARVRLANIITNR